VDQKKGDTSSSKGPKRKIKRSKNIPLRDKWQRPSKKRHVWGKKTRRVKEREDEKKDNRGGGVASSSNAGQRESPAQQINSSSQKRIKTFQTHCRGDPPKTLDRGPSRKTFKQPKEKKGKNQEKKVLHNTRSGESRRKSQCTVRELVDLTEAAKAFFGKGGNGGEWGAKCSSRQSRGTSGKPRRGVKSLFGPGGRTPTRERNGQGKNLAAHIAAVR